MRVSRGLPYRAAPHLLQGLWLEQAGVCPLCDRSFNAGGLRPVVDHDHSTGAIRGLLCQNCNLRLGHFEAFERSSFEREQRFGTFGVRARAYLVAAKSRGWDQELGESQHTYGPQIAV